MAKDKLTEYSATNASNDVIGDISVAEGMLPSAVNNALREQMTHLKNFADGTDGINVLSLDDDDASASIKIQAPSALTTTTTLTLPDGDGDAGAMLQTDGSGQLAWSTAYRNRNLILNGAQVIDQRNAGASVSGDGKFPVDRWKASKVGSGAFSMQQSSTTPSDFNHSVVCTVTTADTSLAASDEYSYRHFVEGFNFCHANWGTSSAYPITLSFWVRSSVTGTYAVGFRNNAGNRTNPSTYTISSANTWEYKTVTVAGDTTGTWEGATNNIGVGVIFSLGAGSNYQGTANTWNASGTWSTASATQWISTSSATWYVTGIQMELGSQSTAFEHRSFGDELAACQRYTYVYNSQKIGGEKSLCNLAKWSNGTAYGSFSFPMEMRTAPSATIYNKTEFYVYIAGSVGQVSSSDTFGVANQTTDIGEVYIECGEGSSGQAGFMRKAGSTSGTSSGYIVLDAEL